MNRGIGRGLAPGAIFLGDPRGIIFFLAYAPVGLLVGSIGGAHSTGKWQPCMDRLAEDLKGFDPAGELSRRLTDLLRNRGLGNSVVPEGAEDFKETSRRLGVKTILPVEILRVSFRECPESWTFSPEVVIRARLVDESTGTTLREGVFAYGSEKWPKPPYVTGLTPSPACRPIENYCEEGAPVKMKEELSRAIGLTVEDIVGQWNLRADPPL
jgi:hypothetical protein